MNWRDPPAIHIPPADRLQPARPHRAGVDDVEAVDICAAQHQHQGSQQANWAEASHQAAPAVQPVGRRHPIRQPRDLDAYRLVNRLFGDRERLGENADALQLRRHAHDILLLVKHILGLVAVEPPDAALAVLATSAHVGAVYQAWQARPAAAPHSKDRVVAGLDPAHAFADLDHLAEHLVADHQLVLAVRRAGAAAVDLLAVGSADAYPHHPYLDIVRR